MAEKVKPVFRELFQKADQLQNYTINEPVYLQISKASKTQVGQIFLRVTDGEFNISISSDNDNDDSFAAPLRIVRVKRFDIRRLSDQPRVFLHVHEWEDAGPATDKVSGPWSSFKYEVAAKVMDVLKIPVLDEIEDAAPAAVAVSPVVAAAPNQVNRQSDDVGAKGSNRIPIEAVSPYSNNWTLLARVTKKGDIREFTYKNSADVGRMFKLTLTDETGDIDATGFSDAVDTFYNQITEGQQFYFREMNVREANKRFSTSDHDFELHFQKGTKVTPAVDTDVKLPSVFFKFVSSLADLSNHEVNASVDVVAVATNIEPVQTITSKSSNIPYQKRNLDLVDDSGSKITLTLWGQDAEEFDHPAGTVIGVKSARISDFNGLSLSATRNSKVTVDFDEPRAHKLKGWWEAVGGTKSNFSTVTNDNVANGTKDRRDERVTILQTLDKSLGRSEKPEYFQVKARIAQIFNRTVAYPACTNGSCKKKVTEDTQGGQWRCEKCDITIPSPQWRYVLTMLLSDPSVAESGISVSVFDEVGREIYGDRAQEFQELHDAGADGSFNKELAAALREVQGDEYIWTIQGALESYNGEDRPRFTATRVKRPDPILEGELLLSEMGF